MIGPNKKLQNLPPYIFSRIKKLKDEMRKKGIDVIDLDMGNPDQSTPSHIVERLADTVKNHPQTHRYPQAKGMPRLRKAIASWYKERYEKEIDENSEVLVLVGSKEGICHLLMSYLEPGDVALVPNPTYPVHFNGVHLAGGEVYSMPLKEENNYLPDLEAIPKKVLKKAKIIIASYPNNPTTATLPDDKFFKELVAFAKKHNLIVIHDFAYVDVVFDGYKPPSFLAVPGAMDVGVEFYSFS
ncbi:aminotransferase class I/II-fold pyridoxal phosphate-dependent enzyme, partial [Candidatus Kuenenbacteria bacterium]|nr:aminotransferase class I/II-fold pyridoxal phosphate-dependent enzyme [Candidatus Kuenenbacteria bacterium]